MRCSGRAELVFGVGGGGWVRVLRAFSLFADLMVNNCWILSNVSFTSYSPIPHKALFSFLNASIFPILVCCAVVTIVETQANTHHSEVMAV